MRTAGSKPLPTLHCGTSGVSSEMALIHTYSWETLVLPHTGENQSSRNPCKGQAAEKPLKRRFIKSKRVHGMAGHSDQKKFWTPASGELDLILPNKAEEGLVWVRPDFRMGNKCPQAACYGKKNFPLENHGL